MALKRSSPSSAKSSRTSWWTALISTASASWLLRLAAKALIESTVFSSSLTRAWSFLMAS